MSKITLPKLAFALTSFATVTIASGSAQSDSVELRSNDLRLQMHGNAVSFVDGNFVLSTALGPVLVPAHEVDCFGEGCPEVDATKADIRIAIAPTIAIDVARLLSVALAETRGATVTFIQGPDVGYLQAEINERDRTWIVAWQQLSTAEAFEGLLDGEYDLALGSRPSNGVEALLQNATARKTSTELTNVSVGTEVLAVVTHPDNPVRTISLLQLRALLSGKVGNWLQLGGFDAPISVVGAKTDEAARSAIGEMVFGSDELGLANLQFTTLVDNVADEVRQNEAAIGLVPNAGRTGLNALQIVDSCGVISDPSSFMVSLGAYPLSRELSLYDAGTQSELLADLESIVSSDEMVRAMMRAGLHRNGMTVAEVYNVPAAPSLPSGGSALEHRGEASKELSLLGAGHLRLSSALHFDPKFDEPDSEALAMTERIVAQLSTYPDGTSVRLVGFTDSLGDPQVNRMMSRDHARRAIAFLVDTYGDALEGIVFSAHGYGEVSPLACSTSAQGRMLNSRVEVWIKDF